MMNKQEKKTINRRKFLAYSALGLGGLTILPSWIMPDGRRIAPSDRIVAGFIGVGRQGVYDFNTLSKCPGVQVAACADVDQLKRERFKSKVEAWQTTKGNAQHCAMYASYEELLERKDIDVVSIATPDHWHALNAIHACQAGKDVYVQKPLAFTVREGLEITKAVRDNKRMLKVGSQQRSDREFQQAIALVQSGLIGDIETIYASVGAPPKPLDLPEMPVPATLDWDAWVGPLNDPRIHYHPDLCPQISLDPKQDEEIWGAWRWYRETGNGFTGDWGAHMFDIAQAAIGMDGSGPVEFIPKGYNGAQYLTMKYQNGIIMTEQPFREEGGKGICFNGTKGWVRVMRGNIECSDPALLQRVDTSEDNPSHMQDFITSVRTRKDPNTPVEVGCSTNTLCCIANIATELNRPVQWDPVKLSFDRDTEAANHRLYHYLYRKPYALI